MSTVQEKVSNDDTLLLSYRDDVEIVSLQCTVQGALSKQIAHLTLT